MTWQTWWLERTDRVALGLRRYRHVTGETGWSCADGYHRAIRWTGEGEAQFESGNGREWLTRPPDDIPWNDPRWPTGCDSGCGYQFRRWSDYDHWQRWQELIWVRPDTGQRYVLHSIVPPGTEAAGPGASYDAYWFPDDWRGADGIAYVVRCPIGLSDWAVDAPATGGGRWTRTGDPRQCNVTASPSIAIGRPGQPGFYHGFLQNGILTDHLGG